MIWNGEIMRNEDINRYMPVVYKEAVRLKSRLPYSIELDDIISDGIFALLDWLIIYGSESSQEIGQEFETNYTTGNYRQFEKNEEMGKPREVV